MASSSTAIINPQFCVPYTIDLAFTTKPPSGDDKSGHLATVDATGNILFRVNGMAGLSRLQDAAGQTVVTMKPKVIPLQSVL